MELYLVISLLVVIGIAITYKFVIDAREREVQRIAKEEELEQLQHEFLVRYAYNRKDSK
jgi:hypothetical protein